MYSPPQSADYAHDYTESRLTQQELDRMYALHKQREYHLQRKREGLEELPGKEITDRQLGSYGAQR